MLNLMVDVHGVLANYVKSFCEYHELLGVYENWPSGVYDIEKVTGKSWLEFPAENYRQLPETEDFVEIMPLLVGHNISFATHVPNIEVAEAVLYWLARRISPVNLLACSCMKAESAPIDIVQDFILLDDCDDEFHGVASLVNGHWSLAMIDFRVGARRWQPTLRN